MSLVGNLLPRIPHRHIPYTRKMSHWVHFDGTIVLREVVYKTTNEMKTKIAGLYVCAVLMTALSTPLLVGCKASNTAKGTAIGAGTGAVIGGLIGRSSNNTAVGAIIGAGVGGAAGALIGRQMDKQAEELK